MRKMIFVTCFLFSLSTFAIGGASGVAAIADNINGVMKVYKSEKTAAYLVRAGMTKKAAALHSANKLMSLNAKQWSNTIYSQILKRYYADPKNYRKNFQHYVNLERKALSAHLKATNPKYSLVASKMISSLLDSIEKFTMKEVNLNGKMTRVYLDLLIEGGVAKRAATKMLLLEFSRSAELNALIDKKVVHQGRMPGKVKPPKFFKKLTEFGTRLLTRGKKIPLGGQ